MKEAHIVVFEKAGEPLVNETHALPPLKEGEVLVKNRYTTICGSDLHTFCGLRQEKTPTVLGHEIVGEVIEIAEGHSGKDQSGKPLALGDTVTWAVFAAEPQQEWIDRKMPQKSDNLFKYGHARVEGDDIFHGGLGQYTILKPHTAILKVPTTVPLPIAATINCAIATVAGCLRLAGNVTGKTVLVTGLGLLGNTTAAMCKAAGAKSVVAVDINAGRLAQSTAFGVDATYKIDNNLPEIATSLKDHKIDVVFDMSGSPDAVELGIESLTIGGVAVLAGSVFKTRKIEIDAEQIIRRLITIRGLHNYNFEDLQYALDFIVANHTKFPFAQVVAKDFPLEEAQQAFEYAVANKPLRVGVYINS